MTDDDIETIKRPCKLAGQLIKYTKLCGTYRQRRMQYAALQVSPDYKNELLKLSTKSRVTLSVF